MPAPALERAARQAPVWRHRIRARLGPDGGGWPHADRHRDQQGPAGAHHEDRHDGGGHQDQGSATAVHRSIDDTGVTGVAAGLVTVDESVAERYPWIDGPWSFFRTDSPAEVRAVIGDHSLPWDGPDGSAAH